MELHRIEGERLENNKSNLNIQGVQPKNAGGLCTIYLQQQTDLMREGREKTELHEALLEDLQRTIEKGP